MTRDELNYVLRSYKCQKGGMREASVIARDFLRGATPVGNVIYQNDTCVKPEEFLMAVRTLIAGTFLEQDRIPKWWHCEEDCNGASSFLCAGKCNSDIDATERCPFYTEENK